MHAATLFRAVDHGLRLYSGQQTTSLPEAPAVREALASMLNRWMPARIQQKNLEQELHEIQERTRETFERLFN